jgi:hypothetical protein
MVPIGYWQAKSPKLRAGVKNDEGVKKKASRNSPFSNVFPSLLRTSWELPSSLRWRNGCRLLQAEL